MRSAAQIWMECRTFRVEQSFHLPRVPILTGGEAREGWSEGSVIGGEGGGATFGPRFTARRSPTAAEPEVWLGPHWATGEAWEGGGESPPAPEGIRRRGPPADFRPDAPAPPRKHSPHGKSRSAMLARGASGFPVRPSWPASSGSVWAGRIRRSRPRRRRRRRGEGGGGAERCVPGFVPAAGPAGEPDADAALRPAGRAGRRAGRAPPRDHRRRLPLRRQRRPPAARPRRPYGQVPAPAPGRAGPGPAPTQRPAGRGGPLLCRRLALRLGRALLQARSTACQGPSGPSRPPARALRVRFALGLWPSAQRTRRATAQCPALCQAPGTQRPGAQPRAC